MGEGWIATPSGIRQLWPTEHTDYTEESVTTTHTKHTKELLEAGLPTGRAPILDTET